MSEKLAEAIHYPDSDMAVFKSPDKTRSLVRRGGSLPWRLFNCGNLVAPLNSAGKPAPKATKGYIGFGQSKKRKHYYFIFPDYETGRRELKASLLRKYKDKTLSQAIHIYAPPNDGNNTEHYIATVSKISGVARAELIGKLSDERLEKLMDAMIQMEGYEKDAHTRKEDWVNVTQIHATDGTRPIAGEEIIVQTGNQTKTLKSNSAGVFPPIVHLDKPVKVKHVTADGREKDLGELPTDKGARLNLTTKVAEFLAKTGPVEPVGKPVEARQPFVYVVKQGDILGRLAIDFRTTVQDIVSDNNLNSTKILVGQRLGIYGPPPKSSAQAKPKKALRTQPTPPSSQSIRLAVPPPATCRTLESGASADAAPTRVQGPTRDQQAAKPAQTRETVSQPPETTSNGPVSATLPAASPKAPPVAQAPGGQQTANQQKRTSVPSEPEKRTAPARSKQGKGEPLATFPMVSGVAPWMPIALEEAKKHRGVHESIITKTANYHKIIRSGSTDLVTSAWCAAFASWSLWKAGYPILTPGKGYDSYDVGRANGFRLVKYRANGVLTIKDNPLYVQIEKPVFGAIAVVISPANHGEHVGFVYAKMSDNLLVLLGGNQGNSLKFSAFNIKPVKGVYNPETKKLEGSSPNHLEYFLPASYTNPDSNGPNQLQMGNDEALNTAAGIAFKKKTKKQESTT